MLLSSESMVANANMIPSTGVVPEWTVDSRKNIVLFLGFLFLEVRVVYFSAFVSLALVLVVWKVSWFPSRCLR